LLFGLMTSPVQPLPATIDPGTALSLEGNSILYVLAKLAVFGKLLPLPASFGGLPPVLYMARYYLLGIPAPLGGMDVMLNQVAWAGWAGLLVTGLNLIPAGQLDGGHALYVLFGEKGARRLQPVILVVLVALGFFWTGWFLWAGLIFFFGRTYAEPLDQITRLDARRKILAGMVLILFILVITPIPLTEIAGAALR
jgi:membrane-associated protease RseP (regulator of RpoE activity)